MAKRTAKVVSPTAPTATGPRPRLSKLVIRNFRCIQSEPVSIDLDDIVVLVGPNNAGKSSVLKAYEVIMSEGSEAGKLAMEDFPNGKVDPAALPEIELQTIVYDNSPGDEWIGRTASNEMLVREMWTWSEPGAPTRRGYIAKEGRWATDADAEKVPWGAAGVANARRPQPHRVDAFASPDVQATEIIQLLKSAINERVKSHQAGGRSDAESDYSRLLSTVGALQAQMVAESQNQIEKIQQELTSYVEKVFPNHKVVFDAHPEDIPDKAITFFKADAQLLMGPASGHLSTISRQGSGARRTLLWTAIRLLAETVTRPKAEPTQRPHVLLLDEPEICLHPHAIRQAAELLYGLPATTSNWQVVLTTHSPCFVDFSRNHTSIVRVQIGAAGHVVGTTIFRPDRANFSDDDREHLKFMNLCDPYVAEFFFGGHTIVVEGDTEHTAFGHVLARAVETYRDIHIVRARGKPLIPLLCRILNQFGSSYAVLHDADAPTYTKDGRDCANPAWGVNKTILSAMSEANGATRLVAALPDFDRAFLDSRPTREKPYVALMRMRDDAPLRVRVGELLTALTDFAAPLPAGCCEWRTLPELEAALVNARAQQAVGESRTSRRE